MAETCSEQTKVRANGGDDGLWQDIPKNSLSPFIHRFQTQRNKYVYDVNTRRIIRVSPVVWDVLEDYGQVGDQEIIVKYSGTHDHEQVKAALSRISQAQEHRGLFLSIRPKEILLPRKDKIWKRLEEQREQLILNVTEECNFRCSYCIFSGQYEHYRTHSSCAMTWDVARPAIDEFLAHSKHSECRIISFYGGEPLLNMPLIRQCVAYVRQKYEGLDVNFSLTTNGYLLRSATVRFLANEQFLILVSLDGPQEIHDRHRRTRNGRPTWARVVSNIREFIAAYPDYETNNRLRFNAVATRQTDLSRAQCFWDSSDIFTDCMGLEVSEQKQTSGEPDLLLSEGSLVTSSKVLYEQFIRDLKNGLCEKERNKSSKWLETAIFERPFVKFHKRGYLSPHLPEKMVFLNHCVPGTRRTFVSAEGNYFTCERVAPCREQIIGNVKDGVCLEKVMALLDKWSQANRDQCRYCWCLPLCGVGCLATVGNDGILRPDDKKKACAQHRQTMHFVLIDYCSVLEENPTAFDYTADFVLQ